MSTPRNHLVVFARDVAHFHWWQRQNPAGRSKAIYARNLSSVRGLWLPRVEVVVAEGATPAPEFAEWLALWRAERAA